MPQVADIQTWAIQAEDSPAHMARVVASATLAEGVIGVGGGAYQVTEDTGANMKVSVGSGAVGDLAAIQGESAGQGIYVAEHQAGSQLLDIAASDPTNDRIDLIIARVYDDESDSSGNNYADLEVVQGTPAGSPSVPALPGGAIPLAEVLVQNGVTAITDADITDVREEAAGRGQHVLSVIFVNTGSLAKADYPWMRKVRYRLVGGGGAGGGVPSAASGQQAVGAGGGGGGYCEGEVDRDDLGTSEAVTIGNGGTGSTGAGTAGGTTSFAGASAGGGGGGSSMTSGTSFAASDPGAGGTASGADLHVPGSDGTHGGRLSATLHTRSGYGGASVLGGVSQGVGTNNVGVAGKLYGGGGSGGCSVDGGASRVGGAGGKGIAILDLYA